MRVLSCPGTQRSAPARAQVYLDHSHLVVSCKLISFFLCDLQICEVVFLCGSPPARIVLGGQITRPKRNTNADHNPYHHIFIKLKGQASVRILPAVGCLCINFLSSNQTL